MMILKDVQESEHNVQVTSMPIVDNNKASVNWANRRNSIPHIVKYMGAKKQILDFVVNGIKEVYEDGHLCDLFAGTAVLSGALSSVMPMHSNDVQAYSKVMADLYLTAEKPASSDLCAQLIGKAYKHSEALKRVCGVEIINYAQDLTRNDFLKIEDLHRGLINKSFNNIDFYLFTKNYSGTYWSTEQAIWIDSLMKAAEGLKGKIAYNQVLASLMYAMSYSAQSTGHFAQYRDAATEESFVDILKYRQKNFVDLFKNKFTELSALNPNTMNGHVSTTLDYKECLNMLPKGGVVYADPPYGAVHYSRFYHALETLVKYDYPQVQFKGRYRTDRHQSPFCTKTKVKSAFQSIFHGVKSKNASLVLSYSDNGMIGLDSLYSLCETELKSTHSIVCSKIDYSHSTMGRAEDRNRDVKECLILAKRK